MAKTVEKASIEGILKKKQLLDETVKKPYFCEYLGAEIEIENDSPEKLSKVMNKEHEDGFRADCELVYAFCPIFRSKELQKQLGVEDPIDTVKMALANNVFEIQSIAKNILKRYGVDTEKVENIKKP